MTYHIIVEIASSYSVLLPLSVGIYKARCMRPRSLYIFLLWLVSNAIINLLNVILAASDINNLLIMQLYTLLEFTFLTLLYRAIVRRKIIRKAATFCLAAFFIFKVIDMRYITGLYQIDTWAITIESMVMIVFGFFCFAQLLDERNSTLVGKPVFWINTGILVYFSGSFFIFLYSTYIFSNAEEYYMYWSIHNMLVIVRDVLFAIGMIVLSSSDANPLGRARVLATY